MNDLPRRDFLRLALATGAASLLPSTIRANPSEPFSLDPLPYPADALEPHLDTRTMQLHHDKHHRAYVTNLNRAVSGQAALQNKTLDQLQTFLPDIEDPTVRTIVRNNGGGDWNHRFFWSIMSPADRSGTPSAELDAAIRAAFGSLEQMKTAFNQAALGTFGSGWAWLIRTGDGLKIVSTPNQDNPLMKGTVPESSLGTPILGVDVWEHAYYLLYQNRRADYLNAWWNVVNWPEVSARFARASL
ncbi:MAG: superoxide dismutase [Verrucomicrobiia bacterium]